MYNVKTRDYELFKQVTNKSNVYLAYLRVKNQPQNKELYTSQEILYFERELEKNLCCVINKLNNPVESKLNPFDFILKIKKLDKDEVKFRPLVKLNFVDEVVIQSVINIISKELVNYLPKENLGVQLTNENDENMYENWIKQYKKFTSMQRERLSKHTDFLCAYEYDIKQFYPSIQQKKLFKDIVECLQLSDGSEMYKWIERIIYYYSPENISKETKDLYDYYISNNPLNGEDLGLPQGPLYSSFFASFYSRSLFTNIKKEIDKKYKIQSEVFAYVDDGRIFFRTYVMEKEVEEIIQQCLQELNNSDINSKKIEINPDKSHLLYIDEKSTARRLDYINSEISVVNLSINPNFDIDEKEEEAVLNKHENYLKKLTKLKEEAKLKNMPSTNNEIEKIKKDFSTYSKRKATFLTRKIATAEKFYSVVDSIYFINENYSNEDELIPDITMMNYYYVLENLVRNVANDEKKMIYLCEKVDKYLNYYSEKISDILKIKKCFAHKYMIYYYSSTIKALYTTKYYQCCLELINKLVALVPSENEKLIAKYYLAYTEKEWIEYYSLNHHIEGIEIDRNKTYEDDITKWSSLDFVTYYINYPILLMNENRNLFFNSYSVVFNQTGTYTLLKKYDSNDSLYKKYNYDIYETTIREDLKLDLNRKAYMWIDDCQLKETQKVRSLLALVKFWSYELKYKGYILPSYLKTDNVIIKNNTSKEGNTELLLVNNISKFYKDFEIWKFRLDYKKYFLEFFRKIFECDENILINKKGRALKFWEYRILAYLSYSHFNKVAFLEMLIELLENRDFYNHDVNADFERIRKIVDTKLADSKDKDIILQLHYYIQCIWKNGSKDLPFFTLHNHEHSVALIVNYMDMSKKMISKLHLNNKELLILFEACYLHDVGMLKGLTKKEKFNLEDSRIIKHYNSLYEHHSKMFLQKIESTLNHGYEIENETSNLYESIVRGDHHIRAKLDIRSNDNLPISDLEKEYVGIVSENHGNEADDVYGKDNKGFLQGKSVDLRKVSMWLRLLDLTDITKYRVTQEVFNQYFDRMSNTSKFHWMKHLSVDDIQFSVKQPLNILGQDKDQPTEFTIKIILNYIPPVEMLNKECKKIKDNSEKCIFFEERDSDGEEKGKLFVPGNQRTNKYCDLRCCFLNQNYWFFQEIDMINEYARIYDEQITVDLQYVLSEDTRREDFKILKGNDSSQTATLIAREQLNY